MADFKNLNLSDESLTLLLQFVLQNIGEDRKLALENYETLSAMLGGGDGMTGLEIQLMLQELSSALTGFLNSASKSTDNAIKIAKIMSDHINKMNTEETLTNLDRDKIENLVKEAKAERSEIENVIEMRRQSGNK